MYIPTLSYASQLNITWSHVYLCYFTCTYIYNKLRLNARGADSNNKIMCALRCKHSLSRVHAPHSLCTRVYERRYTNIIFKCTVHTHTCILD